MSTPEDPGRPWEPVPETAEALREFDRLGDTTLGADLRAMAERVRAVVPELVGMSLALLADGVTLTLVTSSEAVAELDATQYLDGGPCVAAAERAETLDVNVDDLLDEGRWQLYARASAAGGIASSLSMPVMDGDQVVGGVNLYASTPDAFSGRHGSIAGAVGADAALAVANADLSFRTRAQAADAPTVLRDDSDVNIALGIIASSQDVSIPVAQERLRAAADQTGITEAQAARAVLNAHSR